MGSLWVAGMLVVIGHRLIRETFVGKPLDLVITVCNNAKESCPVFPRTVKRLHWPFHDPLGVYGTEEVRKAAAFRRARDQIHGRIMVFLDGCESLR